MKKIRSWIYNDLYGNKKLVLYPQYIVLVRTFNESLFEKKYTFCEFLENKKIFASPKIDYEILKEIIKLQPKEYFSVFCEKKWDFWTCYDNSDVIEEKVNALGEYFLYKTKYGFADMFCDNRTKKETKLKWQRPDNFFFYGPILDNIDIESRKRLKYEILSNLKNNNSKLTKSDGFLIFDYSKIKEVEFKLIDGIRGIYFKIINGKVIVGGWDNPRDGGENYFSVEYLWYNTEACLPEEFHDKIQYIIDVLDEAIVHE